MENRIIIKDIKIDTSIRITFQEVLGVYPEEIELGKIEEQIFLNYSINEVICKLLEKYDILNIYEWADYINNMQYLYDKEE